MFRFIYNLFFLLNISVSNTSCCLICLSSASSEGQPEKEGGRRKDQEGQAGQREGRKGERGETQEEQAPRHGYRSFDACVFVCGFVEKENVLHLCIFLRFHLGAVKVHASVEKLCACLCLCKREREKGHWYL